MISCETFHALFAPGTDDVAALEHLRSCDACLDMAAHVDPDVMFRAIGGEMIPPGGVEAFTEDVMRQIHVRGTEHQLTPQRVVLSWPRRLAVAAMFVIGFTGALVFYPRDVDAPAIAPTKIASAIKPLKLTTKPIVESYDSANATILEVPTEGADDTRIVMIFDENLPADL
jgi:hypothetical protein